MEQLKIHEDKLIPAAPDRCARIGAASGIISAVLTGAGFGVYLADSPGAIALADNGPFSADGVLGAYLPGATYAVAMIAISVALIANPVSRTRVGRSVSVGRGV
jgi:hypothetical protein